MKSEHLTFLKDFPFPLNVYAHVIMEEEGSVDYLHYGLFDRPEVSATAAQALSTELLQRHLPPPCKLLEVGVGIGTALALLTEAGFDATGITPDAAQVASVRARFESKLAVQCCALEDFSDSLGSWDLMLFQESSQYIDPIDLFEKADQLLGEQGEIIVLDEFALRRDMPGRDNLHFITHFLRLAERFGFTPVLHEDLSKEAAPTLDWLLRAVDRHRMSLKEALGVSDAQLDALNVSNRRYKENYAAGRYGYLLLKLRRTVRPRWRVGRIHKHRAKAMRELFVQVFGHEMSEEHWNWKYGDGRGAGIGVWRQDGILVAHYGGTTRNILYFGKPEIAFQACDLMVAVSERGTLSRKGPVFLAASTFLEHELGFGAPHLLGIGFPNEKAYHVPERLGLYTGCLGRIQEVTWPAMQKRHSMLHLVREIDPLDACSTEMMSLCWQKMSGSLTEHVVGVRDPAYLRQRYVEHPDKKYSFFVVKSRVSVNPLGIFIVRSLEDSRCELLDVIGSRADIPKLVYFARMVAGAMGCTVLFTWLVDNILSAFDLQEASVNDLKVLVPGNNWTDAPDNSLITGKWWLTGGDTDFH